LARIEPFSNADAHPARQVKTRSVAREEKLLSDLKLEISHQLGDAIRDVDLNYGLMRTNRNQAAATEASSSP
jgi:hypothetical protein